MKRAFWMWITASAAAVWLGCSGTAEPPTPAVQQQAASETPTETPSQGDESAALTELVTVTLSVPNMV